MRLFSRPVPILSLSKPSLIVRQLILLLMLTFSGVYRRARDNDKAYVKQFACSATWEVSSAIDERLNWISAMPSIWIWEQEQCNIEFWDFLYFVYN